MSTLRRASTHRMMGTVKAWYPRNGHGLIEYEKSTTKHDVFFHVTDARPARRGVSPRIEQNQRVLFTLDIRGGQFVARDVTRPDGTPFDMVSSDPTFRKRVGHSYQMKHFTKHFGKKHGTLSEDVDT